MPNPKGINQYSKGSSKSSSKGRSPKAPNVIPSMTQALTNMMANKSIVPGRKSGKIIEGVKSK